MCKHRIQEWIKHNAGRKDNPAPKQDALFLAEKQQLMAALTSTTNWIFPSSSSWWDISMDSVSTKINS